ASGTGGELARALAAHPAGTRGGQPHPAPRRQPLWTGALAAGPAAAVHPLLRLIVHRGRHGRESRRGARGGRCAPDPRLRPGGHRAAARQLVRVPRPAAGPVWEARLAGRAARFLTLGRRRAVRLAMRPGVRSRASVPGHGGREPPVGGGGGTAHPWLSPRAGLCLRPHTAEGGAWTRSVLSS